MSRVCQGVDKETLFNTPEEGLTEMEARKRIERFGYNRLNVKEDNKWLKVRLNKMSNARAKPCFPSLASLVCMEKLANRLPIPDYAAGSGVCPAHAPHDLDGNRD